jgi:two-component system response regulator HydG
MARILLVEDDADVRTLMQHVLIDGGHDIDARATMREGLDQLERHSYDLVIADGKLPDGTGMDIADRARALGVRALIVTAYAFTLPGAVRERYEILLKPVRPAELVAAVDAALAEPPPCA